MDRPNQKSLLFLLTISTLSACSSQPAEGDYSFRVFRESGVSISKTTNGPKYSSPIFSLEEVVRINEDESIESSLLARPLWMGIDEDATIYVLDGISTFEETRLLAFDRNGNFSHSIGRMGHGPGEYQYPVITDIRNDRISMYDSRRITHFSTTGELLDLLTVKTAGDGIPEMAYWLDGDTLVMIYRLRQGGYPDPVSQYASKAVIVAANEDTLGIVESPFVSTAQVMQADMPGRGQVQFVTPALFLPHSVLLFDPERGLMTTTGITPEVEWYQLDGKLRSVYQLGIPAREVGAEDRAIADRFMSEGYSAYGETGQEYLRIWRRDASYPEMKAHWKNAQLDEYGYLWLEDSGSHFHRTERRFIVVSPQGEYLGECAFPHGEGWISKGHYLLIDEDVEAGEQHLIVYKIQSLVEGLEYPN